MRSSGVAGRPYWLTFFGGEVHTGGGADRRDLGGSAGRPTSTHGVERKMLPAPPASQRPSHWRDVSRFHGGRKAISSAARTGRRRRSALNVSLQLFFGRVALG